MPCDLIKMLYFRTFFSLCAFLLPLSVKTQDDSDNSGPTEHPGGSIVDREVFHKSGSPYWLRNDLLVERNAELIIEPGVTVKFDPQLGLTVRGILNAQVMVFLL